MDNNILASEYGIGQLKDMAGKGWRIDLNQGMDARLVTEEIADVLASLQWIKYIRFSCDTVSQVKHIDRVRSYWRKGESSRIGSLSICL